VNILKLLFDIDFIILKPLGYSLSLLELIGVLSGLFCVYLTAKEKLSGWIFGIVNALFFLIMFYQVRLYSDTILQVYYFFMSIYGFIKWSTPRKTKDKCERLKVTSMEKKALILDLTAVVVSVFLLGFFMRSLHNILPLFFPEPAAFPFGDAFTTIMSLNAQVFMTHKKRESWLMWVSVDIVATIIYFIKGINLVAIEYIVFGIISSYGFYKWNKSYALESVKQTLPLKESAT